ncbi:MAG: MnmC family methyltransferase [Planctomycetota bacterium]
MRYSSDSAMCGEDYLLTSEIAYRLLQSQSGARLVISLDLNLSTVEVHVEPDGVRLPDSRVVGRDQLRAMARRPKRVFALTDNGPQGVEIARDHYYKLTPTAGAPTIEIDGVQMHRTKDIDPFEDARQKVEGTVRRGDRVLDTCGGLGYTAIWAVRMGAERVVSVEVCEDVRTLRAKNPWSRDLHDARIELVDGDVFAYVKNSNDASFDSIIHDPPRFSLAGELYGSEFYGHLFRVLSDGGRLFHYTGAPHSRSGRRDVPTEVQRRLETAGFHTRREPGKLGIAGWK